MGDAAFGLICWVHCSYGKSNPSPPSPSDATGVTAATAGVPGVTGVTGVTDVGADVGAAVGGGPAVAPEGTTGVSIRPGSVGAAWTPLSGPSSRGRTPVEG